MDFLHTLCPFPAVTRVCKMADEIEIAAGSAWHNIFKVGKKADSIIDDMSKKNLDKRLPFHLS